MILMGSVVKVKYFKSVSYCSKFEVPFLSFLIEGVHIFIMAAYMSKLQERFQFTNMPLIANVTS